MKTLKDKHLIYGRHSDKLKRDKRLQENKKHKNVIDKGRNIMYYFNCVDHIGTNLDVKV